MYKTFPNHIYNLKNGKLEELTIYNYRRIVKEKR